MLKLGSIGSPATARAIAQRAALHVTAYQRKLVAAHVERDGPFEALPTIDKASYLVGARYEDLLGDDYEKTFSIFSSSGSSGHPFYWPQLKGAEQTSVAGLRTFLEKSFDIDRVRTLAIVGLALGSWIGGDHVSWALKTLAVQTPHPFAVFSPGSRHDEILRMLQSAGPFVDQVLLFLCPSAIGHMQLRAEQAGIALPREKLRYVTLGEPFPESLRTALAVDAGLPPGRPVMLSIYGSADTGVIGVESAASVIARQLLDDDPNLATRLSLPRPAPHLFHAVGQDVYVETIDGELHVTRWQGVPLVRYNLHDAATLLSWPALLMELLPRARNDAERAVLQAASTLPDIIAITGRADRCLILCGTNLTEDMLAAAVQAPELSDRLTGVYRARIGYDGARQFLDLEVEHRPETPQDADSLYRGLIASLGRAQPEFLDDWQNVYHVWDDDPSKRIIRLTVRPWPALSESGSIKQRGIVS